MDQRWADGDAGAMQGGAEAPGFLFATCQVGAERALKSELARLWPAFHFAYSRPGFLTFKLPPAHGLPADFDLRSVFARAHGFSLAKATGVTPQERADILWRIAGGRAFDALHVWQRDTATPGFHGFEPGMTPAAQEARAAILAARDGFLSETGSFSASQQKRATAGLSSSASIYNARLAPKVELVETAPPGALVLDCVLVEVNEWWVGYHRAATSASCQSGGFFDAPLPAEAVSRAYQKIEEALLWAQFPLKRGDRWVEIGCSPGGASQALLGHGLIVTGVDPADVDPGVVAHPNFKHVKKRGADVRRREFRDFRWLAADMNVAPSYTLDTVEAIVTHESVDVHGMLLTLKLIDWNLAQDLPHWLQRIHKWGYAIVHARQLAHNRQEICVAAARNAAVLSRR